LQKREVYLTLKDLLLVRSQTGFVEKLKGRNIDTKKIAALLKYEEELEKLQIELVKMQRWVQEKKRRIAIIFEGCDAAGKDGTIRRFIEHLNPRTLPVVALPKPTEEETGQWYFQRYIEQLPNRGELVFFDRSWYNRAVVETESRGGKPRSGTKQISHVVGRTENRPAKRWVVLATHLLF
jgi:polyphosphate kinase 2 (PPK2 family)